MIELFSHFAGGGWLPYLEGIHDAQWESAVEPYWLDIAELVTDEHPQLLVCLELHPGTVVSNLETFNRTAARSPFRPGSTCWRPGRRSM